MRVFVVGASGAIGQPLVRQLIASGHEVIGTHHRPETADRLRTLGARPVQLDLLDAPRVRRAMLDAGPDAVIHEATALGNAHMGRKSMKSAGRVTIQLRGQGMDTLLSVGKEVGVKRFVAQSFGNFRHRRDSGRPRSETDPVHPSPPKDVREPYEVMRHLEENVAAAGGVALRYGVFYGAGDTWGAMVQKRKMPMIGDGASVWSFIHLEDAAATVLALEHGRPGVYNIVDDDPAPVREWLPAMAAAIGARPARRVPLWLAKLFGGGMVAMMSESAGLSNAKAKRELGWTPKYPSWRQGFPAAYSGLVNK